MIGTDQNPLRVAIIGSGPSGFYAAEYLQKQKELVVQIDMFERLPTPFGLVRGGVAPDHQKIKSVTKLYDRIASHDQFRFYGNVEFGKDITIDDIGNYYHAVIYAVGAQSDRKLGIPGEDLPGSYPATEFVGWYNAHPDYKHFKFDLSQESVAVIGVGNVAMDVVRMLAATRNEMMKTDIADYAMEELDNSNVKKIYLLGRRGPAQAKYTPKEIKELGEMEDAMPVVSPEEVALDPLSQEYLDNEADRDAIKNMEHLVRYSEEPVTGKSVEIIFRFLTSPVEVIGDDKVTAMKIVKNELYKTDRGDVRPRATEEFETIPVGLVFRSVGYKGTGLPGVPFYPNWGIIPNENGRVLLEFGGEEKLKGNYVAGWIKRGPSGVIGTNKPDSVETAIMLLADLEEDNLLEPANPNRTALEEMLKQRNIEYVTYADWLILDELEIERGEAQGRPRVKFSEVEEMLNALREHKSTAVPAGD